MRREGTLKCQICEKTGLMPGGPLLAGRKEVICQNEYVSHVRVDGREYLVKAKTIEFIYGLIKEKYDGVLKRLAE